MSCPVMGVWGLSEMPETNRDEYNVLKPYNRKREQLSIVKYYDRMRELGCFSLQDVTDMVGERSAVAYLVNDYQRKGYIDRIHRNLYTVMDTEKEEPVLTKYQIGSRLFPDAYICLRSAFEVHGYAPRGGNEVFVATGTRFTDFRYNGVFYRRVHPKAIATTEWFAGSLVTSLEQTVVDSLHCFEGSRGLEDVVECIVRLPQMDADKLLQCLERYGNGYLYQKCGYVLEQLQEYVKLPEAFYRECRAHCASTVRYMVKGAEGQVYHKGWGVYAPAYLRCRADEDKVL
jgi:predicted transcriptional regulator of viral defense system